VNTTDGTNPSVFAPSSRRSAKSFEPADLPHRLLTLLMQFNAQTDTD
jgi:hypothetical protein